MNIVSGQMVGYRIRVTGIVQGVGFRPFVYRLACQLDMKGWVLNSSAGVLIEVEGEADRVREFARLLVESPPPLAVIRGCEVVEVAPRGFTDFVIRESEREEDIEVMISPDIAICEDCKREVRDPQDRRFGYPFTNCTNCGPRFTIIKDVPYDRKMTTMAPFPMCPQCQEEYENPLHRRFHAQPNACPLCGPHTSLLDREGRGVEATPVQLLKAGYILAVKGLGGFHLAADATNRQAVRELRARKRRDAKPFAVMARDLEAAKRYCRVRPLEEQWLTSPQAPIVILERKADGRLPDQDIHPGISTLGVMLPYTPLHYLLFDEEIDLLIMTSANISDEPLIIENAEALAQLNQVADYFLVHNRDIYNPCDDSVMRVTPMDTPQLYRRARGLVPLGIPLPMETRPVLAVGGELKNTFCMTRGREAFLSQHWGDLNHYHNYSKFLQGIPRFTRMLNVQPEIIAHDLHPNYQTTIWAGQQTDWVRIPVQHHHAHMASAMAENGLTGQVLALVCDGTGWGSDGAVWGCEILQGGYTGFARRGHLKYVPLPGGDVSINRPYRMALVYLVQALGEEGLAVAERYLPDLLPPERDLLLAQVDKGLQVVPTSSCGRLFDAVSALLGLCPVSRYEGQAAVELEAALLPGESGIYAYDLEQENGVWIMNVFHLWRDLVADLKQGVETGDISRRFHLTLIDMMVTLLEQLGEESGLSRVVLSGGTFYNQFLLAGMVSRLKASGFEVYFQQKVPTGDGGISLGQSVIASEVSR